MNGFLMVLGGFLGLIGLTTILVLVGIQIKMCFEEFDDGTGILIIFLILIGILGAVICALAYNAEVTRTAYENLHIMYSEVTT